MQQSGTRPQIRVRRSADRFVTVAPERPDALAGWATTRHSFSFGQHYDPDRVGFGPLLALNDETIRAGEHYPEHTHRDVEIVTWVLSGRLLHGDSLDEDSALTLQHGHVQLLGAGTGVRHVEAAGPDGSVRFLQAWLRPDESTTARVWEMGGVTTESFGSTWTVLASGDPGSPAADEALIHPRSAGTTLWVRRLLPGQQETVPVAPSAYVFFAHGSVEVTGPGGIEVLEDGDALELAAAPPLQILALREAEVLLWTFAA